jgi:EF-hand domain pair
VIDALALVPHDRGVKLTQSLDDAAPVASQPNANEHYRETAKLLMAKYGYHVKTMFEHYDESKDGAIDAGELVGLLRDAGFGNAITRRIVANIAVKKGDVDGDNKLQRNELDPHLKKVDTNQDGDITPDEIDATSR